MFAVTYLSFMWEEASKPVLFMFPPLSPPKCARFQESVMFYELHIYFYVPEFLLDVLLIRPFSMRPLCNRGAFSLASVRQNRMEPVAALPRAVEAPNVLASQQEV